MTGTLPLMSDQIARKLATLAKVDVDQWLRQNGYHGMAAVAMYKKVRLARAAIAAEERTTNTPNRSHA